MMKRLVPLTVSKSTKNSPTILLTKDFRQFSLLQPVSQEAMLTVSIYRLIYKHFKIQLLEIGEFTFKDTKYICVEKRNETIEILPWNDYFWNSKPRFNDFLRPVDLFKMMLLEMYFPIFGEIQKLILLDSKINLVAEATPVLFQQKSIKFNQNSLHVIGLNRPEYKQFLSYLKPVLFDKLEDFQALNHHNLHQSLKYKTSLFPEIRNGYWNEIKKCFDADFQHYINMEIKNYILKL